MLKFKIVLIGVGLLAFDAIAQENLRDPTRPLVAPLARQNEGLVLQAILGQPNARRVIINGVSLKEGDVYQSNRITEIGENYVLVQKGQTAKKIWLRARFFNQ